MFFPCTPICFSVALGCQSNLTEMTWYLRRCISLLFLSHRNLFQVVEEACTNLLPNVVCEYLYNLSEMFTKFYTNCQVYVFPFASLFTLLAVPHWKSDAIKPLLFSLITGGWVTGGDEPATALPSDCCCHASVLSAARDYAGLQAVSSGALNSSSPISSRRNLIHHGCGFCLVT